VKGFLLDTNVVSELRKQDRGDPHLRRWVSAHRASDFWLSVLVVGELDRGVELIARRDPAASVALRQWLDSLVDEFADRLLPITAPIARQWALLNVPDPVPVVDGLLAATAMVHGLTLVTRNIADVARTGVGCVDPFASTR
jgi:predicted nucleic acid-binding protein